MPDPRRVSKTRDIFSSIITSSRYMSWIENLTTCIENYVSFHFKPQMRELKLFEKVSSFFLLQAAHCLFQTEDVSWKCFLRLGRVVQEFKRTPVNFLRCGGKKRWAWGSYSMSTIAFWKLVVFLRKLTVSAETSKMMGKSSLLHRPAFHSLKHSNHDVLMHQNIYFDIVIIVCWFCLHCKQKLSHTL